MTPNEQLHPHVERAAMDTYQPRTGDMLVAVSAAVAEERRMILDVVDAMAGRACCVHQRVLLNQILGIYGREPVVDATMTTPERCPLDRAA